MNKFCLKNIKLIVSIICSVLLLVLTIYLIYNIYLLKNIENFFRAIIIIFLCIIFLFFILFFIRSNKNNKNKLIVFCSIICIFYSFILYFVGFNVNKIYLSINNIANSFTTTSISLVTMIDNNNDDIKKIGNGKVGILSDNNNNKLAREIVQKYSINSDNLVEMNSYVDLINGLYNKDIEYAFLPTNYSIMFQNIDSFSTIFNDTKIIYTEEKTIEIEITNDQKIDEPFTVLIMGVDSELENIKDSSFNGDSLILLTFNPQKLSSTILSIPRDTYVPISCFSGNRKNKITHAAWYGEDCMIETIEDFLDVKVDYYVKINFKGVVKLVDALGGIEVDVPIDFCEQDSNRNFNNLICVDKGYQTLNGEQALALARHRKTINDIVRGENQQLVIKGLLNRVKNINSLDTIYSILDTISNNMKTNMSTNEILSLYNVAKKIINKSKNANIDELISIQKLNITGYDAYIYDYSSIDRQGTKLTLYNFVPYQSSIDEVIIAMKTNLDLIESIENNNINGNNYSKNNVYLLPDFIGSNKSVAISYGEENGININVEYVTSSNPNYQIGEIIDQSLPKGMDLNYISTDGLSITVVEAIEIEEQLKIEEKKINCAKEENKESSVCEIPNFVGKYYSEFEEWTKLNNYSYRIKVNEVVKDEQNYDKNKKGIIISQTPTSGSIYNIIGNVIEITYISEE